MTGDRFIVRYTMESIVTIVTVSYRGVIPAQNFQLHP